MYTSCYGLDTLDGDELDRSLDALYEDMGVANGIATGSGKISPLLLVFTCEQWKLRGWRENLRKHAIVAAVETKPLQITSSSSGKGSSQRNRRVWHCNDCFDYSRDIVLP